MFEDSRYAAGLPITYKFRRWQRQCFLLNDSWYWIIGDLFLRLVERGRGSTKTAIRKIPDTLRSLRISVENQHRCQTFTPKPNARLVLFFIFWGGFFFLRSLPSTNIAPIPEFDKEPSSGATSPSFQPRPRSQTPPGARPKRLPVDITVRAADSGVCKCHQSLFIWPRTLSSHVYVAGILWLCKDAHTRTRV